MVNMEVDTLPKPTTMVDMMAEMKGLACQQLAEQLTASEKITLHSDGTSKFGQRYGEYSLGLSETLTGSAEVALSTLKVILSD